jgi:hypothetical protein
MNIHDLHFSKRDNEKLVTDAKADEAIANIALSRCHALKSRPRTTAEKTFKESLSRPEPARHLCIAGSLYEPIFY